MSDSPRKARSLVLEAHLPGTPDEVARMLTDPAALARWFAPPVEDRRRLALLERRVVVWERRPSPLSRDAVGHRLFGPEGLALEPRTAIPGCPHASRRAGRRALPAGPNQRSARRRKAPNGWALHPR